MSWEVIVSLYAAIIATVALIWNIIDSRKKDTPEFLIKCGYRIIRSEEQGVYYFNSLKINVVNIKDIPRRVRIYGIEYFIKADLDSLQFYENIGVDSEYSPLLNNSQEFTFEIKDELLKWLRPEIISKFRIVVLDNTNKFYRSNFYYTLSDEDLKYRVLCIDASKIK
jgi:hypothetical protein